MADVEISKKQSFTLDGVSTTKYNVGLSGSGRYRSAQRDVSTEHLSHRNGDIITDGGCFFNTTISYPCWIAHTFTSDFVSFRNFLMKHSDKYYKLTDTYDANHFRMARVIGPIEPETKVMLRVGTFDVQFDCKPQIFRNDGDSFRTVSSQITNPTDFECYPILSVGSNGSYSVNGYEFTVSGATGFPVFIDCETMDAYNSNGDNMNKYVSLPIRNIRLGSGVNKVSGTVSIKPRWFDM